MSFNWNDYLEIASIINDPQYEDLINLHKEAWLRSAISRAYYSAFQISYDFALKTEQSVINSWKSWEKHQKLIIWYDSKNRSGLGRPYGNISQKLDELRSKRNAADYDNRIMNPLREAQAALITAQVIINAVNSLSRK